MKKAPWGMNYYMCEVSELGCISSMSEVSFLQILVTLVHFIHEMPFTKILRAWRMCDKNIGDIMQRL